MFKFPRPLKMQPAFYEDDEPHFVDKDHGILLKCMGPEGVKEHNRLLAIHRQEQTKAQTNVRPDR